MPEFAYGSLNRSVALLLTLATLSGVEQPSIAIDQIEKLEFRQTNTGVTVIAIAGAVAIAAAIILATNPSDESP